MCQNCQTTHLSRRVPSPKDLGKLDKFDLSFLIMTGYAKVVPPEQALAIVHKAADMILWGPEAAVMTAALRKGWKASGWDAVADDIIDCFDLTGDISVDTGKLYKLLDSPRYQNVGSKAWKQCKEKVLAVEQKLMERSGKYFKKNNKPVEKVERVEKVDRKWLNNYAKAGAETMAEAVVHYPTMDMSRTILDVEAQAAKTLSKRTVDKLALKQRVRAIRDLPSTYMGNVADVEAGRVWNHVGIRHAYEQSFTTYQVISEEDNRVCPVCTMIHGRTFSVQKAMEKIDSYVASGGGIASSSESFPFPRAKALDNRGPADWAGMDLTPPFHPRCRCDVTLIFSATTTIPSAPTRKPSAPPSVTKPKPKPKPKPQKDPQIPLPVEIGPAQPVPPIKPAHVRAGGVPRPTTTKRPKPTVPPAEKPKPIDEAPLPPGTNVPLNGRQKEAIENLEELGKLKLKPFEQRLKHHSKEAGEAWDAAVAKMRELMGTRELAFCMNRGLHNGSASWKGYLKDGKMKNQFQLKVRTSGGSNSGYKGGGRDQWEENIFKGAFQKNPEYKRMRSGPDVRMEAKCAAERPKYGYIFDPENPFAHHRYGEITFRFKRDAVLNRCTFTIGNSSGLYGVGESGSTQLGTAARPQSLVKKRIGNMSPEYEGDKMKKTLDGFVDKKFRGHQHGTEYIEIQVHGDLQLTRDVEKVFFPEDKSFDYVEELCKKYKLKFHRYTYAEKKAMEAGERSGWWYD